MGIIYSADRGSIPRSSTHTEGRTMATKVKEITSNPHGDPKLCAICNERSDRVRHDQVWAFTRANPGQAGLKADTKV